MYKCPEFDIGQEVRFLEQLFDFTEYPEYSGEFTVIGHLIDDDERPLKDHVLLSSNGTSNRLDGAVHTSVLELVPNKPTMPNLGVTN